MLLNPVSVAWLVSQCGGRVGVDDLHQTYTFEHELNRAKSLVREEVDTRASEFFRWWVEFTNADGERVLDVPLSRAVYREFPLLSAPGSVGHVAHNQLFFVAEKFQYKGFATAVYPREEDLYAKWNVVEVQLHAIGDGCVVWVKKFGFQLKDAELYAADFPGWARLNKVDPTVPMVASEYPDAFLRSRQELHAYKVIRR